MVGEYLVAITAYTNAAVLPSGNILLLAVLSAIVATPIIWVVIVASEGIRCSSSLAFAILGERKRNQVG